MGKRVFDIIFSLVVILLVLWWLFLIIAILIKVSSPGPVIYGQKRGGRNGKVFTCYKFRSMEVNDMADELAATKDDSRKTWIGKILRKFDIDELPQFFNVLLGDMSIVGPRPHMLKHDEEFARMVPDYPKRFAVKPGITGWAQVTGFRGEISEYTQIEGRVKKDLWYIEHQSFALDMKVIYLTVRNLIGHRNEY